MDEHAWGRVDETGTVFVRDGSAERAVGQFPDGSPEEAMAYFERKYTELAGQVTLLEQRAKRGAPAQDIAKAVAHLSETLVEPNAVGDLESLRARILALGGTLTELTEKQGEEAKAAVAAALTQREELVAQIEALAAKDPAKAQWKQVSATVEELFSRWQHQQTEGPRLPKRDADDLWKRFRAARSTLDGHRRAFYAELDTVHKEARAVKQELVDKAEALTAKGADGIPAYRDLLAAWKSAGRAGKKIDDALWAKFKAAGDALYAAKAEVDTRDNAEFEANLAVKLELLAEAEKLLTETDRSKAKEALRSIQDRWEKAGKVPREQVRVVEDRLRKVETVVRKLDDDHWQRSNPERQERSEGFLGKLNESISRLERELEEAKAAGDPKKIAAAQDALDVQKSWLGAIRA